MKKMSSISVSGPTYGIGHSSRQTALLNTAKLSGWEISNHVISELDPILPQLNTIGQSIEHSTCLIVDLDPRFAVKYSDDLNVGLGGNRLPHLQKILIDGESDFPTRRVLNLIHFDMVIFPYGNLGQDAKGRELRGFGYSIFSNNLQVIRKEKTYSTDDVQNILVSCGGSDPNNISAYFLEILSHFTTSKLHIKVILGKYFSENQINNLDRISTRVNHRVDFLKAPDSLDSVFASTDISLVTGGLTRNESMYCGICTVVADINVSQSRSTSLFASRNAVVSLGILNLEDVQNHRSYPQDLIFSIINDRNRQRVVAENGKLCFPENGALQLLENIGDVCLK